LSGEWEYGLRVSLYPGDGSGFGIVNVDSHERVTEILLGHPASPFIECEVQPLNDFNKSVEKMLDVLRKQSQ